MNRSKNAFFRNMISFFRSLAPKGILYSCKEVSYLLTTQQNLSGPSKLRLQLHLRICKACKNFKKQAEFIDKKSHTIYSLNLNQEQKNQIEHSKKQILSKYTQK